MVYTLEKLGYIRKHPVTRRYQLTPHVMRIGFNYLAADTLIDVANPFLSELTNLTGETTNLTEPDEDEMVYVARFVSTKFVPIHMPIGSRIPMYCTGSGRAFLSALPPADARARLDGMARPLHTPRTVTALDELVALLDSARLEGYATNQEELFIGDMSIAAPVLGSQAAGGRRARGGADEPLDLRRRAPQARAGRNRLRTRHQQFDPDARVARATWQTPRALSQHVGLHDARVPLPISLPAPDACSYAVAGPRGAGLTTASPSSAFSPIPFDLTRCLRSSTLRTLQV